MVIRAVIFDMDGVISDTQTLYAESESEALKPYGIEMAPEDQSPADIKVPDLRELWLDTLLA